MKAPRCVECRNHARLAESQAVYPFAPQYWGRPIWLCRCGAYVGCHPGTNKPLGNPAGKEARAARQDAHAAFDDLWRRKMVRDKCSKTKARRAGYAWLADQLAIHPDKCHISMMNADQARLVVKLCNGLKRSSNNEKAGT